jgi:hypothetical protein
MASTPKKDGKDDHDGLCACFASCDISACDDAAKHGHGVMVASNCGKCPLDDEGDNKQTCMESCPKEDAKDCAAIEARFAEGGCASSCPPCVKATMRAAGKDGKVCSVPADATTATPAKEDPCKDLKDEALAGCTTANLVAPDCACNKHYDEFFVEVSKASDTHDADGCKAMQPLFDCAKKDENWPKCKVLDDVESPKEKYADSTYKKQEDACAELIVSGAASTGTGILLGLSTLLALRLL